MKNIIFIGTNFFAASILDKFLKKNKNIKLVITKQDKFFGRGQKKKSFPVKNIALKNNIPLLTTDNINNELSRIKSLTPDIIIITDYAEKIEKNIIKIPKNGIINIHPSLLPNLRGPTPIQTAIIKNLKETGVSIIKINEKYDAGKIINSAKQIIKKDETYKSLLKKLITLSYKILLKTLIDIKKKNIKLKKQNKKDITYTKKLDKAFYKINWKDSAIKINSNIRSTFDILKHHTYIENNYINIIETKVLKKNKKINLNPGTIVKSNKFGIDVTTGDGILRIKKMQFSGKKINKINDILKSKQNLFKIGKFFG